MSPAQRRDLGERILRHLKRFGPAPSRVLAEALGVSIKSISTRASTLKMMGKVKRDEGLWMV